MNKDLIDDRFGRFREIPLALENMGHSIFGLCLSYLPKNSGWIKDDLLWKSINATTLKIPGLIRYIFETYKYAKKADIIWACSDSIYGIIACIVGRSLSKPVVFDIYDDFDEFVLGKFLIVKHLYHWAIRKSDAVTSFSIPFTNYIKQIFPEQKKIYTIENAVDHNLFKPLDKQKCRQCFNLPQNAKIIGTAGALYKRREVDLLFDAFQNLKTKYDNLHLAVAGPRDNELCIPEEPNIHDLGVLPLEAVPFFLNSLDIAIVCYANDEFGKICFPQKTFEIMACDIPIVASNVGYLSYLFSERKSWLYFPGNLESLVTAIIRRMEDQSTDYQIVPTWNDSAAIIEHILIKIFNQHKNNRA